MSLMSTSVELKSIFNFIFINRLASVQVNLILDWGSIPSLATYKPSHFLTVLKSMF